jgi:hypothetical protein
MKWGYSRLQNSSNSRRIIFHCIQCNESLSTCFYYTFSDITSSLLLYDVSSADSDGLVSTSRSVPLEELSTFVPFSNLRVESWRTSPVLWVNDCLMAARKVIHWKDKGYRGALQRENKFNRIKRTSKKFMILYTINCAIFHTTNEFPGHGCPGLRDSQAYVICTRVNGNADSARMLIALVYILES